MCTLFQYDKLLKKKKNYDEVIIFALEINDHIFIIIKIIEKKKVEICFSRDLLLHD